MKVRREAVAAAAVLAVAFGATGCVARHAREARPLRLAFTDRLVSLNPIYLSGFNGAAIEALAYSFLLRPLPDGRLVPDVAVAVPTLANGGLSRDGRSVTYRLRRGVRWQDGAPLTSADVAFTVAAILNPRNAIGSRDPFDRIASVETPDAFTVRVRLREADAAMVGLFLTPDCNAAILPRHLLERYGSLDRVPFNALPIGSGPYRVISWTRDARVRFTANPLYYGGMPKLHALELRYVPDTATALVQMRSGELDGALNVDLALIDRYRALAHARVTSVPYTGATAVMFNTERPTLGDARMRRALAQGVDVRSLVRDAYRDAVSPDDAARGIFSYADDPRISWPRYDPGAAAHALDALGWSRDATGLRKKEGRQLVLSLVFSSVSAAYATAAIVLQQAFARLGIRVELQSFTYAQYYALATDGGPLARGRFDLALVNYSTNVDPDQAWLLSCRERAPYGYNYSRYCSPGVDKLVADSARAIEPARRTALVRAIERAVAEDVPFVPLWQAHEIDVTPEALHGFRPNGALPYDSARQWSL